MRFEKLSPKGLSEDQFGVRRIIETGDVVQVNSYSSINREPAIKKLSATEYVRLSDGEILEFESHAETRDESQKSLRSTFEHIRQMVNCNVTKANAECVRWCTLTYADRSVSGRDGADRVCRDFVKFWQKFKRWCKKNGYSIPEYINVVEPQGDGVWHCHVLIIFSHKAPFIANDLFAEMWGQGFVNVKKLPHDNLGTYLCAYLGDVPVDEATPQDLRCGVVEEKEVEVDGQKQKKKFVKGGRLWRYPSGMQILRCSKGVKRPVVYEATPEQVKEKVRNHSLTFETATQMTSEETDFKMLLRKQYYKTNDTTEDGEKI